MPSKYWTSCINPQTKNKRKNKILSFSHFVKKLLLVGLFALFGLVIYHPSLKGDFILDDYTSIVKNVYIRTLSDPATLYSFAPGRFVSYLTFAVNYQLGKLDTLSYHLTNTVFHIITSILVFVFVSELTQKKYSYLALFVAFLFLVHPVQTQAVSYITQRMASLAAMFYILALILFIRARLKFNKTYIAVIVASLISQFSKEISYTIPITLLLTGIFFLKEKYSWKRIFLSVAPLFARAIFRLNVGLSLKPIKDPIQYENNPF